MNKQFLKLLFKQLFEAEAKRLRYTDSGTPVNQDAIELAKAAEAQCVENIDSYLMYHTKP